MRNALTVLVAFVLLGLPSQVDAQAPTSVEPFNLATVDIAGRERTTETAVRSKLARARDAFRRAFLRRSGERETDAETCHEHP